MIFIPLQPARQNRLNEIHACPLLVLHILSYYQVEDGSDFFSVSSFCAHTAKEWAVMAELESFPINSCLKPNF